MWRNRTSKPCTNATAVGSVRPRLEQLEDRTVLTNITWQGGPTISSDPNHGGSPQTAHVQVTNIVTGTPLVDTTSIMQAIVKDYLPLLGPDYGIGSGTFQGSVSVAAPSSNPTGTDLDKLVKTEIQSGAVPTPGPNQVYMIFLEPGQYVAGTQGRYGHSWVSVNGTGAYYAFVPGTYQQGPIGTSVASSSVGDALADTVTNPTGNGWNEQSLGQDGGVADIYNGAPFFSLDGHQFTPLSGPQGQMIPQPSPPPTTPPGGGGNGEGNNGGGNGGGSVGVAPVSFFQAAITLYIDGVEKVIQSDSAALEQSIQANLPYAIFAGIDLGEFLVLSGELAAYNALHGNNNGGHS